jgi:hypothetical protein
MNRSADALDRRSLDLHRLIARHLDERPELLRTALKTLRRWRAGDPRGCAGWDEWESLIRQGLRPTTAAMLDPTERGQYLRSCTPFTRVLTPRERWDFLRRWNASS